MTIGLSVILLLVRNAYVNLPPKLGQAPLAEQPLPPPPRLVTTVDTTRWGSMSTILRVEQVVQREVDVEKRNLTIEE